MNSIEAGEIEYAAVKYGYVESAYVLYDAEKRQIVLCYVAATADDKAKGDTRKWGIIDEVEYRRWLMTELPVYMVPTRYERLAKMPLNANGKKDREELKRRYLDNKGA